MRGSDGARVWQRRNPNRGELTVAVGDIDGDGGTDFVRWGVDGPFYVFDRDMELLAFSGADARDLWGPIKVPTGLEPNEDPSRYGFVSFADITTDGIDDVLLNAYVGVEDDTGTRSESHGSVVNAATGEAVWSARSIGYLGAPAGPSLDDVEGRDVYEIKWGGDAAGDSIVLRAGSTGLPLWTATLPRGSADDVFAANVDGHAGPEIVVWTHDVTVTGPEDDPHVEHSYGVAVFGADGLRWST